MRKNLIVMILLLQTFVAAEHCYFQSHRTTYDAGTVLKKISCSSLSQAVQDIHFYDDYNNYARYYGRQFGREGNLIYENNGDVLITKFYYALGEYRYYGQIGYRGTNVAKCSTTTSSGLCSSVEYTEFGMYLRDFFLLQLGKRINCRKNEGT